MDTNRFEWKWSKQKKNKRKYKKLMKRFKERQREIILIIKSIALIDKEEIAESNSTSEWKAIITTQFKCKFNVNFSQPELLSFAFLNNFFFIFVCCFFSKFSSQYFKCRFWFDFFFHFFPIHRKENTKFCTGKSWNFEFFRFRNPTLKLINFTWANYHEVITRSSWMSLEFIFCIYTYSF